MQRFRSLASPSSGEPGRVRVGVTLVVGEVTEAGNREDTMAEQGEQRDGLIKLGRRGWAIVGVIAASVVIYLILAGLSGLVIPLIVAGVIGALFVPLVDKLTKHMHRTLAAGIVLVGLIVIGVGAVVVAVAGVAEQAPEVEKQLNAGLGTAKDWLQGAGVDLGSIGDAANGSGTAADASSGGLGTLVKTIFSSITAFAVGTFIGLFFLFYILVDWDEFTRWIGSHLGVPNDLGKEMVEDATWSVRRYFYALSVTSLVTAVAIGGTAIVIGVPLAFTIALVTFVTSYIPYLGAWVSGAFAVVIALGSGGPGDAAIILAVILLVQMVVQPLLLNQMSATQLDLNPAVSFGSTILGAMLAGVLGATLSAPVVAAIMKINTDVKNYHAKPGEADRA
jgi:predicted PurR-regulated permease PerM